MLRFENVKIRSVDLQSKCSKCSCPIFIPHNWKPEICRECKHKDDDHKELAPKFIASPVSGSKSEPHKPRFDPEIERKQNDDHRVLQNDNEKKKFFCFVKIDVFEFQD